ncbi:MAG TPA: hypothetical protein VEQ85_12790, partial [Lacipirellulaceae bacterium]|nr:hypothetical protein [Lacipirellulaceae bacterium]
MPSLPPNRLLAAAVALTAALLAPAEADSAISLASSDSFGADLEGWAQAQPPVGLVGLTRATTGGPAGAGDAFMRIESSGLNGARSKMVAYYTGSDWFGDYTAAGVTRIGMSLRNLGATDLVVRLALASFDGPGTTNGVNSGGNWIVSTVGVPLPAMSAWTNVEFSLAESQFTGTGYAGVMSGVKGFRIYHAENDQTQGIGDTIAGVLGVDNIVALGAAATPGDFDGMGGVTALDLAKWRTDVGSPNSDADGDGDTDGNDFVLWQRNLGQGAAASAIAPVPEPAAWLLAACGLAAGRLAGVRGLRSR